MNIQKQLHAVFLESPSNLFDAFIDECKKWYDKPAHNFVELKTRENKKLRGDIFEEFCVIYLKNIKKYTNVWRLEDVPEDILKFLNLQRRDMGIDIIAEKNGKYIAVQCKYKKPTLKKTYVSWKTLSTFYALCMRSGPWDSYIVMTNCNYVTYVGKKTEKDISICLHSFQNITKEEWISMCDIEGNIINENNIKINLSLDDLRKVRLAYYDKKIEKIIT
jgi:predicted helicase